MGSKGHFVYIIQSGKTGRYYTGYSENPDLRLRQHNDGWSRSTKCGIPWKVVYLESYFDKVTALRREREIKGRRSRKYIEKLIHAEGRPVDPAEVRRLSKKSFFVVMKSPPQADEPSQC